jgi:hypothetical protein
MENREYLGSNDSAYCCFAKAEILWIFRSANFLRYFDY